MRRKSLRGVRLFATGVAVTAGVHSAASAQSLSDLRNMSLEDLAKLSVSSVSKSPQPLADAPASIYVINHDQIVRSGAVTIPEMLRLAPNLQVYQTSPSNWVVTARGLNGNPTAQSFSNKLLVLVDGRTVYTPLFAGVYWDLPDVIPEDIDRIEVVSGPGATLWGANAVNGVINIITRHSSDTTGVLVDAEGGAVQQALGVRIGGSSRNSKLNYRVYGRWLSQDAANRPTGGSAHDGWGRIGGGFRLDWTPNERDAVSLQGDIFDGNERLPGPGNEDISGRNLVLRWNRRIADDEALQAQAFYDHFKRDDRASGGGSFFADTYDVDLQHSFGLGSRHHLVWGGGARVVHYRIDGTPSFFFDPDSRNLVLANVFVQDTFDVSKAVSVTAGIKAEHDPYVGVSLLPELRLSVKPTKSTLLWGAVSRAIRSPTPFDEDVQERAGIVSLSGNTDFRTEKLTAYELGFRSNPLGDLSVSATAFYHDYDDLRSIEIAPGPGFNIFWGNGIEGNIKGIEAWASATPFSWWRLSAGATLLKKDLHFKEGASGILGTSQDGIDPGHVFKLSSSMNLSRSILFDLSFRSYGKLKDAGVPAYSELGGRIAWNVTDHLTLSLSGANLLHKDHVEYLGDAIQRKVLAGLQWRP